MHAHVLSRDQDRRLEELASAALAFRRWTPIIVSWGTHLAGVLEAGGRLLTCGNGGSAAEAQHLSAELVGRFEDERRPFAAIPLHADTSSVTAIGNDYGAEQVFARQVRAHGRPGDVLVCFSTSGNSPNVVAAARQGRRSGLTVWALTGPGPNSLAAAAHQAITVDAPRTSTVQEIHLAALHLLCGQVDQSIQDER
ncbi:D-sedoheptulose-7-phosphate isomerase [Actinomadura gamaensis]|uniref:SIS domain-containing protein n=1 Tax=Actinomadura gamaensis TaxID=1763541 RepID=A0ABV9TT67_9ACTN